MKADSDLRKDVEEELDYDPDLESSEIGISVQGGVVSLSGFAPSYNKKMQAETDVKRVSGVLGVANDIQVRLPTSDMRPDPDIAREIVSELRVDFPYGPEGIRPTVSHGWVILEGAAEWNFQRERAEAAARRVKGVLGVTNSIRIEPKVSASEIKARIENAFRRSAQIDANRIAVHVEGSEVELTGSVRSWTEREEAQRAAWLGPGVTCVENHISVRP